MASFLQKAGKCFQLIDPKLMNNKDNEGKVRVYKELKTSWKQVENNSDHLIILESVVDPKFCTGYITRDIIDDVCQIMELWQTQLMKEYDKIAKKEFINYESKDFHYVYWLATKRNRVKNILVKASKSLGDITFHDMSMMVAYKKLRNGIAHKEMWNVGKNQNIHDRAIGLIKVATDTKLITDIDKTYTHDMNISNHDLPTIRTSLEKCARSLYG